MLWYLKKAKTVSENWLSQIAENSQYPLHLPATPFVLPCPTYFNAFCLRRSPVAGLQGCIEYFSVSETFLWNCRQNFHWWWMSYINRSLKCPVFRFRISESDLSVCRWSRASRFHSLQLCRFVLQLTLVLFFFLFFLLFIFCR